MSQDLEFDFSSPEPTVPARDVYSPARLNREARILLERGFSSLWVEGEISNLSRPSSGHWYFSLKDADAQLRCAMFRQRNLLIRFTPKDGMLIQARGRVSLYEQRGDYQFLVDVIEETGEGALRRRFDQLKARLSAEGLFGPERKRALPALPRRIGVITSPTGAAIRDVLNILRRRFCSIPILVYPVPVQGAAAAPAIAAAIRLAARRAECDVLIIARGGGSLEDLWAFNDELVARAIFECTIPVVSGVGHEVDFTIADFVADVRAPTPSGAAELIAPDCGEWLRRVLANARRLSLAWQRSLTAHRERLRWVTKRLDQMHPGVALRQRHQRLDELEQRMRRTMLHGLQRRAARLHQRSAQLRHASPALRLGAARARLHTARTATLTAVRRHIAVAHSRLAVAAGTLDVVSPLATLQRGYAIVTDVSGHVITDTHAVAIGDAVQARIASGRLQLRVEGRVIEQSPTASAKPGTAP